MIYSYIGSRSRYGSIALLMVSRGRRRKKALNFAKNLSKWENFWHSWHNVRTGGVTIGRAIWPQIKSAKGSLLRKKTYRSGKTSGNSMASMSQPAVSGCRPTVLYFAKNFYRRGKTSGIHVRTGCQNRNNGHVFLALRTPTND